MAAKKKKAKKKVALKRVKAKRVRAGSLRKCSTCGKPGHNQRTCMGYR